jgi:hypothetical protein
LPAFERGRPSSETGSNKKLIVKHMGPLQKQFSLYLKDMDDSKLEWVRGPFAVNNVTGLATCEQEQLTEISRDRSLEYMFHEEKLPQFWLLVKNYFSS